jgi:D-lyxose ketol-isomerase
MMEEKILQAVGVYKGDNEHKLQLFKVVGEDENGVKYSLVFACKEMYTETLSNAFRRLHPLLREEEVNTKEGDKPND